MSALHFHKEKHVRLQEKPRMARIGCLLQNIFYEQYCVQTIKFIFHDLCVLIGAGAEENWLPSIKDNHTLFKPQS